MHCGAELLVLRLLEGMSSFGHTIDMIAFDSTGLGENCVAKSFRSLCRDIIIHRPGPAARWYSPRRLVSMPSRATAGTLQLQTPEFLGSLRKVVSNTNFDVVIFCALRMTYFANKILGGVKIAFPIDCHSLALERAKRPLNPLKRLNWELHKMKTKRMESAYERFSACVFVAPDDASRARQISPGINAICIPNGVDTDYFRPTGCDEDNCSVAFIGAMGHPPNVEAVLWFSTHVWPRLVAHNANAKFYVVGANPTDQIRGLSNSRNVFVTGTVPDVRTYINRVQVLVVPMQSGGGIKNKVLEGMASSKPIVANMLAVAGIEHVEPQRHFVLAEKPIEFSDAILSLWENAQKRRQIGESARDLSIEHHAWAQTQCKWENLLQGFAASSQPVH